MRYDINLVEERRRWTLSTFVGRPEGLQKALGSNIFILGLLVAVLAGVGYFGVYETLFSSSSAEERNIEELRIIVQGLEAQRLEVIQEGEAAYRTRYAIPRWSTIVFAIGKHVPEGIWLTRVALEREKVSRNRRRASSGNKAQEVPLKKYLVIEGQVDSRSHPYPLEPVSKYLEALHTDQRIAAFIPSLQLSSGETTEDKPNIVSFQIRGAFGSDQGRENLSDKIANWLKTRGLHGNEGA
jgi:hypothetical protein